MNDVGLVTLIQEKLLRYLVGMKCLTTRFL